MNIFNLPDPRYEQLIPVTLNTMEIPRIIHQAYFVRKGDNLPDELANNIASLKALNPDWEYRYYDDNDMRSFIQKEYPGILVYYDRITEGYGAARADLFRYLLLFQCGGVYLDIKSTILRPLSSTISQVDGFLLSNWSEWNEGCPLDDYCGQHRELSKISGGEYLQWFIVAAPGHPYLKAVITQVLKNIDNYQPDLDGVGKMGVLRVTGPIAFTLAIEPCRKKYPVQLRRCREEFGFEYSIFGREFSHKNLFKTIPVQDRFLKY